ncbi:DUF1203 domain-containing protein [Kiloniella laminariae]|uniref:DUF1203 domain-containing protein n=1 Tax=Kiloniella laminariae TaxID=454162 RepID=A0ABT4LPN7_9PROT|nr:DUF1203 domain-containing protein [Kiloniella laminariae]MCZ4282855.1 DUF1203 domain-containing protein [Kiloniella laminariae]
MAIQEKSATIRFVAMPSDKARAYQSGTADENGQEPEVHISDGEGNPCRHCLKYVAKDEQVLLLSYRPFHRKRPFAETGPIFLHANSCERAIESDVVPEVLEGRDSILIRGYDVDERIIYGTGEIVSSQALKAQCLKLFEQPDVAYIHVRSATNNCYSCRIERG